ncbi:hypothetical protein V5N11_006420 [Cardamine amara subsp. amara]|uniref:Retrotransposon Copia-like N-terminal domain-containing protein n=1 Tax=Cardamine amara subsp. amara TaxID=228776 RepID=A0ABD1B0F7_CARAN
METSKFFTLPVVLKGSNYLLWSRTTKTALRSRGVWIHCLSSEEMPQEQAVVGPAAGAGTVAGVAQVEGESGVEAGGGEVESQAQISSKPRGFQVDPRRSVGVGCSSELLRAKYPSFLFLYRDS